MYYFVAASGRLAIASFVGFKTILVLQNPEWHVMVDD